MASYDGDYSAKLSCTAWRATARPSIHHQCHTTSPSTSQHNKGHMQTRDSIHLHPLRFLLNPTRTIHPCIDAFSSSSLIYTFCV
ncbi:hypothetical protein VTJ04DRAFT_8035 [Mycothermus thermophilus]|uniref:uncharacterized protein n=1 Tax=Humicola insolens TaxID=85995 RepID=UPI003743E11B